MKLLLKRIYYRIQKFFCTRKYKGLIVYKPCVVDILGGVDGLLEFNKIWGNHYVKQCKFRGRITVKKDGRLISNGFRIYSGSVVSVQPNAILTFGKNGYMNNNGTIHCFNSITIGDDVCISENCTLRDSDNHEMLREGYTQSAPIVIGNHVWIGLNVTILKGVNIGDGCMIAAGSVVTKSFPPECLIGGVPAKILRENIRWK